MRACVSIGAAVHGHPLLRMGRGGGGGGYMECALFPIWINCCNYTRRRQGRSGTGYHYFYLWIPGLPLNLITVNVLINAHSQISASYLISAPLRY